MPSFIIDPVLVTTPISKGSDQDIERWFHALEAWVYEIETSPFIWYHLLQCTAKLYEVGRFPTFGTLRELSSRYHFDVNLAKLMRGISAFFQDPARDMKQATFVQYVVFKEDSVAVVPQEFIARNESGVQGVLLEYLLCLCYDKHVPQTKTPSIAVVTMPFASGEREVVVRGNLELAEPDVAEEWLSDKPVDECFQVVLSPDDLVEMVGALDLLAAGPEQFSRFSTRVARRLGDPSPLPVRLGSEFWSSLWESAISANETALKKLVRVSGAILARRDKELNVDLRPLRVHSTADSAQRVRSHDGASAWRLTLTTRGIGWRLHYWHIPSRPPEEVEAIELANVLRESDPERIPE